MKAQFKDMPPLGPGESPWADHEVQLREVLNGAEETLRRDLKLAFWKLWMHKRSSPMRPIAPLIAAAVAGSIVVASIWMSSGESCNHQRPRSLLR